MESVKYIRSNNFNNNRVIGNEFIVAVEDGELEFFYGKTNTLMKFYKRLNSNTLVQKQERFVFVETVKEIDFLLGIDDMVVDLGDITDSKIEDPHISSFSGETKKSFDNISVARDVAKSMIYKAFYKENEIIEFCTYTCPVCNEIHIGKYIKP